MALADSTSQHPQEDDLDLRDIIFSCCICQATIDEVYATTENNKGFHSGSGDDDGIVTKLWITECSHITCAKHLQDGAAPFHPQGLSPRAACPQCSSERGDNSFKELFGIRGLGKSQHASVIPADWLDCPPVKLDASIPGMEALRFQYLNLARYSQKVTKHWKTALAKQKSMELAYSKERSSRRKAHAELDELKARILELEKSESKLLKWEERKPIINHYLNVVNEMSGDLERLRGQMLGLGYAVPHKSYAYENRVGEQTLENCHDNAKNTVMVDHFNASAYRTVRPEGTSFGSSDTLVNHDEVLFSSARKRGHAEYTNDIDGQRHDHMEKPRGDSRQLMPPPLPRSKPSGRTMPPWLPSPPARTSNNSHSRPVSRGDLQAYQNGGYRNVHQTLSKSQSRLLERNPTSSTQRSRRDGPAMPCRPPPASEAHRSSRSTAQRSPKSTNIRLLEDPRISWPVHVDPNTKSFLQSSPSQLYPLAPRIEYQDRASTVDHSTPMRSQSSRVLRLDEMYGPVALQRNDQAREQLNTFSQSRLSRQPPATPSHQRHNPAHGHDPRYAMSQTSSPLEVVALGSSVHSPFFEQQAVPERMSTHRWLSANDTSVRPKFGPLMRDSRHPSIVPSNSSHGQQRSINGLSFIETPHRPANSQPMFQQLQNHYEEGPIAQQTPRNRQDLFRRPDGRPVSQYVAAELPPPSAESSSPRRRITLPPTSSSQRFGQDTALSKIIGVRTFSSRQGPAPQHQPIVKPAVSSLRTLFSSAGGRRSVRR